MSKYTSSPWQAKDKTPGCGGFFIFSGSRYIGFIGDSDLKTDSGANARLAAAAPELLKALEDCIDYGSMTGDDWVKNQAQKAITKAMAK